MRHTLFRPLAVALGMTSATLPGMASAQTQPASASGNVVLYGLVDAYMGSMRRSDQPGRTAVVNSGGMNTAFWGIRGSEDLGGGLQALFSLESFFQVDTGTNGRNATDPYFSKNSWVGLANQYGQLSLGRQTNPLFLATGAFNPFGGSLQLSPLMLQTWSPNYNRAVLGDSVWDNTIQYGSPDVNGFRANALYTFGESQTSTGVRNFNLTVNYANGPFAAVVSGQQAKTGPGFTTSIGSQKVGMGGASYDFRVLRLYGSFYRARTPDLRATSDTTQLGVAVPTGPGRVMASASRTLREVTSAPDTTRNTYALGYGYDLSKRTDLYAVYLRDRATGFGGQNSFAVGMRHRF